MRLTVLFEQYDFHQQKRYKHKYLARESKGVKPSGDWSRICRRDNVISGLHLGPSRGFSICKTRLHDSRYTTSTTLRIAASRLSIGYIQYIFFITPDSDIGTPTGFQKLDFPYRACGYDAH